MSIVNKEEWTKAKEALGIMKPATLGILDLVIQTTHATLGILDPVIQMRCATLGIPGPETRGATGGINTGLDDNGMMMNNDVTDTVIR